MQQPTAIRLEDLLRERSWLSALARRLVADANEADDVAQETLRRALTAGGGAQSAEPRGWLSRTARHVLSERRRSEGRRALRERARAPVEADAGLDPGIALARAELRERVARLVMELGEEERTAVAMRFYEGLDAASIAERTGVSPAAVRQRISRGVGRLRAQLDDADGTDRSWYGVAAGMARGLDGTAAPSRAGVLAAWLVPMVLVVVASVLLLRAPRGTASPPLVEVATGTALAHADSEPLEAPVLPATRVLEPAI